jgi:hypothetical protein
MYEKLSNILVGTDGVLTEFSQDIKEKINETQGYIAAKFEDDNPNKLVTLGVEHTPLYWMMDQNFDPAARPNALLNQRAIRQTATLNSMDQILINLQSEGEVFLPDDSYVQALFPGAKKGARVTIDDGRSQIAMLKDSYAKETTRGQYDALRVNAATAIRGMEAVSPLLVAAAGYRPDLTRKLMGTHLMLDALSGRLNFRTPELSGQTSLIQLLNPYVAMATIGFASKASEEY